MVSLAARRANSGIDARATSRDRRQSALDRVMCPGAFDPADSSLVSSRHASRFGDANVEKLAGSASPLRLLRQRTIAIGRHPSE